jgi:hypothetical protein
MFYNVYFPIFNVNKIYNNRNSYFYLHNIPKVCASRIEKRFWDVQVFFPIYKVCFPPKWFKPFSKCEMPKVRRGKVHSKIVTEILLIRASENVWMKSFIIYFQNFACDMIFNFTISKYICVVCPDFWLLLICQNQNN